jgi:hypothetical protein
MPKKRLLASLAVAAGLGIGGLAGVIVGVPTIAGAQTTTTVPSTEDPAPPATPDSPDTPGTPGTPGTPADPGRGRGGDGNCPDKDAESDDGTGASTGGSADAVFRGGPGGRGGGATSL